MKKLICFMILIVPVFLGFAQDDVTKSREELREEKRAEQVEKVENFIENREFVFHAMSAIPIADEYVHLCFDYTLSVDYDQLTSYLPYRGLEVENGIEVGGYSSENSPFDFAASIRDYELERENDKYLISFQVNNGNENIQCFLRVSESGHAFLKLTSNQRQCIGFQGVIDELEQVPIYTNR